MWNKAAFTYMCYPVDMTTSLSQCFLWIIASFTGVVATFNTMHHSVFTELLINLLKFFPFHWKLKQTSFRDIKNGVKLRHYVIFVRFGYKKSLGSSFFGVWADFHWNYERSFAHHFVIYWLFQNGANKNQHQDSYQRETVPDKFVFFFQNW